MFIEGKDDGDWAYWGEQIRTSSSAAEVFEGDATGFADLISPRNVPRLGCSGENETRVGSRCGALDGKYFGRISARGAEQEGEFSCHVGYKLLRVVAV